KSPPSPHVVPGPAPAKASVPPPLPPIVRGSETASPPAGIPRSSQVVRELVRPPPGSAPPATLKWTPTTVTPERIRRALRESVSADRSIYLLRKLPPVIGRLLEYSDAVPWQLGQNLAGVVDSAALDDEYGVIARIIERAMLRPGRGNRFAQLVAKELSSPM